MASLGEIYPYDRRSQDQMDALLLAEGIRRDKNLDYSCGVFDEDGTLIATGSSFKNTLRCLAANMENTRTGIGTACHSPTACREQHAYRD